MENPQVPPGLLELVASLSTAALVSLARDAMAANDTIMQDAIRDELKRRRPVER